MNLQEALTAALPELRAQAESRMTSRATVKRNTGETTTDGNGYEVPAWETLYVDLPCRLAGVVRGPATSRTVTSGGVEVDLAARAIHFPVWADDLADDDMVEVTAGENMGVFVRIVEASFQDQATARRLPILEAQEPKGWSA